MTVSDLDATGPLSGVRIADFSSTIPGPLATRVLSQLGADVWKIEPPTGDPLRHMPLFGYLNAGKRSVILDLKSPEGLERAQGVIEQSAVVVEGFRPGVMARFGLAHEDIAADRPDLVYCSISAFGQQGPRVDEPAHDINALSLAGILNRNRDSAGNLVEASLPVPFTDWTTGLLAAVAIIAALHERDRTGRGQYADVSMLAASLLLGANNHAHWLATAIDTQRGFGTDSPHYGVFVTADGRGLSLGIAPNEDRFWRSFCEVAGLGHWASTPFDERVKRSDELLGELRAAIRARSLRDWEEALSGSDIPWSPLSSAEEVANDPQLAGHPLPGAEDATIPLGLVDNRARAGAPGLGEHNEELSKLLASPSSADGA